MPTERPRLLAAAWMTERARCAAALAGLALGTALAALSGPTRAEAGPEAMPATQPASASNAAAEAPAAVKPARNSSGPRWRELSDEQQEALAPLEPHWNGLSAGQKRKWMALSRNFDDLSADEQQVLRERMIEWAGLSAQERARARLNYAEVKRLAPADERRAKWEEYQALSEDEKKALAARAKAASRPLGAATPVRPVPPQKLAPVPASTDGQSRRPRIDLTASPPASAGLAGTTQGSPAAAKTAAPAPARGSP